MREQENYHDDFYEGAFVEELLEDDELSAEEEGFMLGYESASEEHEFAEE